jgi:hypothetical protein
MQPQPGTERGLQALLPDLRAVRERPLFPVCVYMMLGIAAGPWLPWLPLAGFAVFMGLLLLCLFLFALKKDITALIMLAAFSAGWALFGAALPRWAADSWAPAGQVELAGRIAEAGVTQSGHASYVLDDVRVNGEPLEGRVAVTTRGAQPEGAEGDILTTYTELSRPAPSRFYGDFNARGWYMRQGIRFTAFVSEPDIEPSGRGERLWNLPGRARRYADGVLKRYLSARNASLVDALLSGDTSDIAEEDRAAFRDLGIAHLLAVSGLNISLTAGAAAVQEAEAADDLVVGPELSRHARLRAFRGAHAFRAARRRDVGRDDGRARCGAALRPDQLPLRRRGRDTRRQSARPLRRRFPVVIRGDRRHIPLVRAAFQARAAQ